MAIIDVIINGHLAVHSMRVPADTEIQAILGSDDHYAE